MLGHASCTCDKNFIWQIFTPKMKELAPSYTLLRSCFRVLLNSLRKPLNPTIWPEGNIDICLFIISGELDIPQKHFYPPPNTTRLDFPATSQRCSFPSTQPLPPTPAGVRLLTRGRGLRPAALLDPPLDPPALAEGRGAACHQDKGGSASLLLQLCCTWNAGSWRQLLPAPGCGCRTEASPGLIPWEWQGVLLAQHRSRRF